MIVAIDEPGHDGHLFGVERLRPLADERLHLWGAPHGGEPGGLDRERLHLRRAGIDRIHLGIEHNQIGVLPFASHCGVWPCPANKRGDAGSGQVQEFSAAVSVIHPRSSSPSLCPRSLPCPVESRRPPGSHIAYGSIPQITVSWLPRQPSPARELQGAGSPCRNCPRDRRTRTAGPGPWTWASTRSRVSYTSWDRRPCIGSRSCTTERRLF